MSRNNIYNHKCHICDDKNTSPSNYLAKMYLKSESREVYLCGKCFAGWVNTA